jgi:serine phosphatase RsbU (regulator of sigma subunit)
VRVDLQYHKPRSGGDFFDAIAVASSRLIFLMLDVAGQRSNAMNLAAFVQDDFRGRTPELFNGVVNESESLTELCLLLNRTILAVAGRAHMTSAFLGVLSTGVGTLTYINAGHVPGLLLNPDSNEFLGPTGLPLGLFSHATHEAGFRVIPCDGALLLPSRGVFEARSESGVLDCIGRSPEFGSQGLLRSVGNVPRVAQSLCRFVLDSAIVHAGRRIDNDMTVAAISRDSAL